MRNVNKLSDYFKLDEKRCEELRLLGADGSSWEIMLDYRSISGNVLLGYSSAYKQKS